MLLLYSINFYSYAYTRSWRAADNRAKGASQCKYCTVSVQYILYNSIGN